MTAKERYTKLSSILDEMYPNAQLELHFENGYQLFVAILLAARCTDKLVNEKTPVLFFKYPSFHALSHASYTELVSLLGDITYAENKAQQLIAAANIIMEKHNGDLPSDIIDLLSLPGIGRKSANTIISEIYNTPAIAVDTHVSRVAQRIGLSKGKDPLAIEKDLMRIIPKANWSNFTRQATLFGRYKCTYNTPTCTNCLAKDFCATKTPDTQTELLLF